MFTFWVSSLLKRINWTGRWAKCITCAKWVASKILIMMTLGYYIRAIIETFQFLLISSISEIYEFNLENKERIISLVVAFVVTLLLLLFDIFSFWISLKIRSTNDSQSNMLNELFRNIKKNRKSRFYTFLLLLRKILIVSLLLIFKEEDRVIILSIMSLIQLIYMITIMIIRPFEHIKLNMIEIMNEIFFTMFTVSLFHFMTKSNWKNTPKFIFSLLLVLNNAFILLIILSKYSIFIK